MISYRTIGSGIACVTVSVILGQITESYVFANPTPAQNGYCHLTTWYNFCPACWVWKDYLPGLDAACEPSPTSQGCPLCMFSTSATQPCADTSSYKCTGIYRDSIDGDGACTGLRDTTQKCNKYITMCQYL